MYSGILSGIYSDILSSIYSGILSGICPELAIWLGSRGRQETKKRKKTNDKERTSKE
jgi:hypothetical protein